MPGRRAMPLVLPIALALLGAASSAPFPPSPPARAVRIGINDNRAPAGTMRGHQLTLRLVARVGTWYPDGDGATGAEVQAFAEEGRAPRIPGPMIRVRAGSRAEVTVRNDIPNTVLVVHGLTSRRVAEAVVDDSLVLAAGEARTVHLSLERPGTYYYWGTTTGRTVGERTKEDAQLTGAIIVDPVTGPRPNDRVMVIGMWSDTAGSALRVRSRLLAVINGRSWPSTERLHYTTGDTVRWRIINASADSHPMHLHGFYYWVDSRGTALADSIYAAGERDFVVTDNMRPGTTMSMTWVPDRGGNWLFHCHLPEHVEPRGPLGMALAKGVSSSPHHGANHALTGMGGLVMGMTVRERGTVKATPSRWAHRSMRLRMEPRAEGTTALPAFAFVLGDGSAAAVPGAAPPLVLTRGEPVSITVVNKLGEPSAIHWHGIELESYFDGVAGFSGTRSRLAPVIAPGDSFVARFTPPRVGTFIYHTHIDEMRQQPAGLAGPIIVLPDRNAYDPTTDISVVASAPRMRDSAGAIIPAIWLNGREAPAPLHLRQGRAHRLRFINISTNSPGLRFQLVRDGTLAEWRTVAKDGADLPSVRQVMRPARTPVSIGETVDVEFTPLSASTYRLEARLVDGRLAGTMLVNVTP